MKRDPRRVFVIHGRNTTAANEMAVFLRAMDLDPLLFDDLRAQMGGTPTIAGIISRGMSEAWAVVALFTGDEYALLRGELHNSLDAAGERSRWQARQNVIFETGMAFGKNRNRVVMVLIGEVQLFSDVAGIPVFRLTTGEVVHREKLRETLRSMGCAVSGTSDWMTAGNFAGCILPAEERHYPYPSSLRQRTDLPRMNDWAPARLAKDILIIGQNLNLVLRQSAFFDQFVTRGCQLRLVIVNPNADGLIEIMSRGVKEGGFTRADFSPAMAAIEKLRKRLPTADRKLVELRTIDYVPTLSCQVLDGRLPNGTILVELAPNRIDVQNRPHFMLHAENVAHAGMYERFLENFEEMFREATPWPW